MAKQKKIVLYSSPLVFVVALLVFGKIQINHLQHEAELLAATGTSAIKLLKEYGAGIKDGDVDRILACYDDSYENPSQGSWREELRSERDSVRVYDWRSESPRQFQKSDMRELLAGYLENIASLEQVKFKVDSVEEILGGDATVVRSILWLRGSRPGGEVFETQATFRMWMHQVGDTWKIHRQNLIFGETVSGTRQGFTDIAQSAGIDFVAQRNPLFSTPEWEPKTFGIIKYGSAGVSAADYDGDGWDDLFFADGKSPRLYRNLGVSGDGASLDGTDASFIDVTAEVGLPLEIPGVNVALFIDLDNDGDKDLLLGRFMEGSLLYRNDGPSVDASGASGPVSFTDVTAEAGLGHHFVVVASAADYDLDGDLDLYLGRYLDPRSELPVTLFYTRNGEGNSLLRNDGNLRFTEVTAEAGVREGGLTLGVAWGDYDTDGDPDLYVANDFGRNALFRNEGDGTFADVTEEAGALDFGFGMSASWGDVDNDGDLDLYISNVHSSQRWYGQSATLYQYLLTSIRQGTISQDYGLYKEIFGYAGADWRDYGDGMVKGNSLLLNDGNGQFEDVAEKARVNPFGWYWASAFLDYDNDGKQDIYAANGWISGKTEDDL